MLNDRFYHEILHEIKNSLTLINGSLQLMIQKHPEVCDFQYWDETMSEIEFLTSMVIQVPPLHSFDSPNLAQTDLSVFMQQTMVSARTLFTGNLKYELSLPENLPLIDADTRLLKQAVINIIKNACEAMGETGIVKIIVSCKDDFVHIAVTDTGGGLNPALAECIFDPFITSKTGGSGLGLVITRQIVDAHHGTLSFDSRPGDGCTFTISLPLKQN